MLSVCSLSKMLCNFGFFSLQPDNVNDYKYIRVYLKQAYACIYIFVMHEISVAARVDSSFDRLIRFRMSRRKCEAV